MPRRTLWFVLLRLMPAFTRRCSRMVAWLAMGCAAVAGFLWPTGVPVPLRRLREVGAAGDRNGVEDVQDEAGRGWMSRERQRWMAAAFAGVAVVLLAGGVGGVLGGCLVGAGAWVGLGRLESQETRLRRARLIADLPVMVDLLAACLLSGASWSEAVDAVADAVGGPLGDELKGVAAQVRLGADPSEAWLTLAAEPELAALARTIARAVDSGAALAPALTRLAQDRRRAARAAAVARAQAAGVRAAAPLGLCFLPAFILLGVVPVVAGIAGTIAIPL
jgi:Flp pilus assembly protein TadB